MDDLIFSYAKLTIVQRKILNYIEWLPDGGFGPIIRYSADDKMRASQGFYENGKLHGPHYWYSYREEIVCACENYEGGKKHGRQIYKYFGHKDNHYQNRWLKEDCCGIL